MNVHHPHTEPRCGCARASDRVGNVVELEVEEDVEATPDQCSNELGARDGEELAADLESAVARIQPTDQRQRGRCIAEVQRDEDPGFAIGIHA